MSKTNGTSATVTSNITSASQSRRNIQIKMKRKKYGMDRPIIASHDFQNCATNTQKLLGFTGSTLQAAT